MKERTLLSLASLVVLVAVVALAVPVSADKEGQLLRVGPGQQYATIQAAVDAAQPYDRIFVYAGAYPEAVSVAKNNLQIVAQGDGVVLTPPGGKPGFDVKADGVTVRGFEISGAVCASGIEFQGSHNTFAQNWIHGFQGPCNPTAIHCVDADGGSDHNTIEYNKVSGAGGGGANYGVFISAGAGALNEGNVIANNTIVQMDSIGVYVGNGAGFRVSGNYLEHMHTSDCILVEASNDTPQGDHTILENTMRGCAGHGIALSASPGTALTHNHISANWVEYCEQDCLALKAGDGAALTHSQVLSNTVSLSNASGILLSAGQDALVNENRVLGNRVLGNAVDGIALTAGSDHNQILNNEVGENQKVGIAVAGDNNLIAHNWLGNNETGTEDTGQDNRWEDNVLPGAHEYRAYLPFAATAPAGKPLRDVGWAIGSRVDGVPVIVHTADGGLSWKAQGDLTPWKGCSANDISAVDHVTAWAALGSSKETETDGAILHTRDGGTTWFSQPIPPGLDGGIKSIKGLHRKEAWAASLRGTILHTTNGGLTWNIVPHDGLPIYQVNRMDAKGKNVWIADAWVDVNDPVGNVVHTRDGGATWTAERLPDDSPLTVHAFSTEAVWASGSWLAKNPAFYRTLDGGATWDHVIQLGLNDHLDDICAASRDDVWGVTNQGSIWRIHMAPDGTPEKHLITPNKELGRLMPEGITCLDTSTAWAVAMGIPHVTDDLGRILHTTDGGKTWVKQPAPADVQYWKVSIAGAKR